MPTYNRPAFLRESLQSVLLQTFSDFEIIITDNSADAESEKVVAEFQDLRIRYFRNEENIGAVNNHNKALALAIGQYIYLFSDDDIMLPDNISDKVAVLDSNPNVGLVHSNVSLIDKNSSEIEKLHWTNLNKEWSIVRQNSLMSKKLAYQLLYHGTIFICMPAVLLRRSVLSTNKIEFNNQLKYMIDWDLFLKMSLFCDFFYIDKKLIFCRTHENNETYKLSRGNFYVELMIAKLSLDSLYKEADWMYPESDFVDVVKSTMRQIKHWKSGLHSSKKIRFMLHIAKRLIKK